ncbi:uncharacterized protein BXZ73DRAFT_101723 [Epithele typhae]|uniref:uncharacterized protein n=1 Tax=Epithele typhae TaxID=378194 RepID=UPI0020080292|nr:uncharacterized protein BXZ73DRAFT_101723 [Epithele typhae]KAH9931139.1 hypothetical protein BXZ73DRAFT_101723 [Epithele typhae]
MAVDVWLLSRSPAAAFADDPRVHYDRNAGTWRFEQDDGSELEYDGAKGAWVPVLDEDLLKAQQAAYSVAGVDEEHQTRQGRRRAAAPSKNTAVYVTGLPPDADADEVAERFGRFGLIEEDDGGDAKVKLYAREDGGFSGDALVVYFKPESVALAITMLDDAELRVGEPATRMRVQRAEFGHKHEGGGAGGGGGEGQQAQAQARPRKTVTDKKRATRRIGKMQRKLGEWDDEDGFGPAITEEDKAIAASKHERVVVLKRMFTLEELEADKSLLLDLKEDVREECSTLGEVTNVVLYDEEADGVMTVKFKDPLSAQACVIKMNGRFFGGRRIEASLFAGRQRFRRSGYGDNFGNGDENEKSRLDDFASWLMAEGE